MRNKDYLYKNYMKERNQNLSSLIFKNFEKIAIPKSLVSDEKIKTALISA